MRDDLLDAYAGVEWANAQLKILDSRVGTWKQNTPYEIVAQPDPQRGQTLYKLANVRPLPIVINFEAGMIIHALRSSLDVLANALAARNGHPGAEKTHFPIRGSRDKFLHGKDAGRKDIRLLSPADQKVIEDLKPWHGGHPLLSDLHALDIIRKHRRLIRPFVDTADMMLSDIPRASEFQRIHSPQGFEDGAIVGRTKIDAPKPDIDLILEVALSEGRTFPPTTITRALDDFSGATAAIIKLFT